MTHNEHQVKLAVAWAAATLTKAGASMYPAAGRLSWDIQMSDGSWVAVNDLAELCAAAKDAKNHYHVAEAAAERAAEQRNEQVLAERGEY